MFSAGYKYIYYYYSPGHKKLYLGKPIRRDRNERECVFAQLQRNIGVRVIPNKFQCIILLGAMADSKCQVAGQSRDNNSSTSTQLTSTRVVVSSCLNNIS